MKIEMRYRKLNFVETASISDYSGTKREKPKTNRMNAIIVENERREMWMYGDSGITFFFLETIENMIGDTCMSSSCIRPSTIFSYTLRFSFSLNVCFLRKEKRTQLVTFNSLVYLRNTTIVFGCPTRHRIYALFLFNLNNNLI